MSQPPTPVIVYFGTDWTGANRTSSHHVARWLGGRYPLLFFECPGLRRPTVSTGDASRLWRKLQSAFAPARHPIPGVTVRTLLQLPLHSSRLARRLNAVLLRWQVRRALRTTPSGSPIISWFVAPHVGSLAGQIGESLCVYYCVDDFSAFAGVDGAAARTMDEYLTRTADMVFVSSATLLEDKQRMAATVHHAPHGVDVEHFRRAVVRPPDAPGDLPIGRPIVGYFGLVAEWIDLELIDRLAARHPEWQFVMIGRIAVPASQLPRRDNLAFLGPRPYEALPTYGAWFDAAIIPYRLTQQVLRANPIKLREYLAMEKPIIAVDTPDIRAFEPLVRIATDDAEWETALTSAITGPRDAALAAAQRSASDAMSWEQRMRTVESLVLQQLERPR